MSETKAHGLAAEIRALKDSEDFDLGGYDGAAAAALMTVAFGEPILLPAGKMIRCSFVIGGGKKVRQKYSETLGKDISMGSFKYQHDTDKDLIKMHVFPKVESITEEEGAEEDDSSRDLPGDAAKLIVSEELVNFRELVATNAPSFIQKKSLLKVMKGVATRFEAFDAKLVNMEPLEPHEQELYDRGCEIAAKVEWLEYELQTMMKNSKLTAGEQKFMVADFQAKIDQMEEMIETQKEKGKKTEKLETQLEVVKAKRDEVAGMTPLPAKKSSFDPKEVEDLRKRVKKLSVLEAKKGLLSGDEAAALAKKPQIEERLKKMEAGDSSGWFDSQVKAMEALVKPKAKPAASKPRPAVSSGGGGSTASARGGVGVGGWSTAGSKGGSRSGGGGGRAAAPSNPFALLGED